ncbi:transcription initiation factor IIF, beta subunit domain-containing protein [Ditylenchus destructor]|uniref:General transcription factor IIF subunit 2 n=1 Tax=Ditylenchus destructor TaxID=166010 RepID=A0AAD4MUL5_9BILA|nr:transcription initiation factor IIF, beta subunit domain-containing protein [Ditylenchus destructor]
MGPRMPENGNHNAPHGSGMHSSSEDEIDVPEEDGWRIGYEVHMEGLGVVNVYDGGMNSDASDDFSTDDEGDIGSEDNSDNEAKRAGYRPLLADASPAAPNIINNELSSVAEPSASNVDHVSVQAKTSLNMPSPPPLPEDLKIPHKPMPIALNEESISQIKSAMSKMDIPTPSWAADLEDNKLSELMSNSKKRPASEIDKVVNCEKSGRGVWLVKVPRYLSEIWEQNAGNEVGKLVTGAGTTVFRSTTKLPAGPGPSQMPGLRLPSTSSSLGATKPGEKPKAKNTEIPDEHRFLIRDLNNQTMAVLLEDKSGLEEEAELRTGKLTVEGRVVKRAECQPPNSLAYMKMKIKQIEKVSQPKQLIQTMDKAVVKFKPTATHNEHLIKEKAKKDGAKTVRGDRDVVTQAIFRAFEKHQYYRLTDLQKLTSQPASFVKEILMDIANYNTTFPHKTMWELKPEYRNYNTTIE